MKWCRMWLLGLLWLLLPLLACSDGELIQLELTGGDCEFPPDPEWHLEVGALGGFSSILPVSAPPGGWPSALGRNGRVALCQGGVGEWEVEEVGVSGQLRHLVVGADGTMLATDVFNRFYVRSSAGVWEVEPHSMGGLWLAMDHRDHEFWMVGLSGSVGRLVPGVSAEIIPTSTWFSLETVLARPDTVYVGGSRGWVQGWANGRWHPLFPGANERMTIEAIVDLDGHDLLLKLSEGDGSLGNQVRVFLRDESGWSERLEFAEFSQDTYKLTSDQEYLWQHGGTTLRRWDLSSEPWTAVTYDTRNLDTDDLAVGPDGLLLVSDRNVLYWLRANDDGSLDILQDPAECLEAESLFRLDDGTVVAPANNFLYEIRDEGSAREVQGLSGETLDFLQLGSKIAGASLDHFLLEHGNRIYECRAGELGTELPYPQGLGRVVDLCVTADGRISMMTSEGGFILDGDSWSPLISGFARSLFKTREQTVVMETIEGIGYIGPNGFVAVPAEPAVVVAFEPEPGQLVIVEPDFDVILYEMGTGILRHLDHDGMLLCESLMPGFGVVAADGALIVTRGLSMVLHLTVIQGHAHWELAAGPCLAEFRAMQPLSGGSLAALDDATERLLIYEPSAP